MKYFPLSSLECPDDSYVAVAAWREITGSHPSIDFLYATDVQLVDGTVRLGLRAREQSKGYAYVQVHLLCRLDQHNEAN